MSGNSVIIQYRKQLPDLMRRTVADYAAASDAHKKLATARQRLVSEIIKNNNTRAGYINLRSAVANRTAIPAVMRAVDVIKKFPSQATAYNWLNAYKAHGINGLVPTRKPAAHPAWGETALKLYHSSTSPTFAQVADELVKLNMLERDGKNHHKKVSRFINSLGAEFGPKSAWRLGRKLHRETQLDFILRHTNNISPGDVYCGDGHTLDVKLAHPTTGGPWRPELTAWMDVRSRIIVGWDIAFAENTISTLTALSRAIVTHDHMPVAIYVDNGSGYKARMMTEENIGMYDQLGITPIFALPGNPRAKWIERFFRTMESRVGKRFITYCGPDHDDRHLKQVIEQAEKGEYTLPTLEQWIAEFETFLHWYNDQPHPEIKGVTRNEVWQQLQKVTPELVTGKILPRVYATVQRGQIKAVGRTYTMNNLHQFNTQRLVVGYDLSSDAQVELYTEAGEFIGYGYLKARHSAVSDSVLKDGKIKRADSRKQRVIRKLRRIEAEEAETRTLDSSHDMLTAIGMTDETTPELEEQTNDIDLDMLFNSMMAGEKHD